MFKLSEIEKLLKIASNTEDKEERATLVNSCLNELLKIEEDVKEKNVYNDIFTVGSCTILSPSITILVPTIIGYIIGRKIRINLFNKKLEKLRQKAYSILSKG